MEAEHGLDPPLVSSCGVTYINADNAGVWCDITEKRGYRADHIKHLLLPESMGGGWLVGPDVDDAYLEVVVEAVRAGRVAAATIKPE